MSGTEPRKGILA